MEIETEQISKKICTKENVEIQNVASSKSILCAAGGFSFLLFQKKKKTIIMEVCPYTTTENGKKIKY